MSTASENQIDLVDNSNRPYRNSNMSESQNQGPVEDKENVQPQSEGNLAIPGILFHANDTCLIRRPLGIET